MEQSEPNLELLLETSVDTFGVENSSFIWVEEMRGPKPAPSRDHPGEKICLTVKPLGREEGWTGAERWVLMASFEPWDLSRVRSWTLQ